MGLNVAAIAQKVPFWFSQSSYSGKMKIEAYSRTIIYPRDDPIATVKVMQIRVPDEIHVVYLIPTPLGRREFQFPLPRPEIIPLKIFLDIRHTHWTTKIAVWQR
jgi:hypothetical protein